jgi:hypothetical protein
MNMKTSDGFGQFPRRKVILGLLLVGAVVSTLGLLSTMSGSSKVPTGSDTTNTTTVEGESLPLGDQQEVQLPGSEEENAQFYGLPVNEDTVLGSLQTPDPVVLDDGSTIVTLVQGSDSGVIEVGVRISGADPKQVRAEDFVVKTSSGTTFTPAEVIDDEGDIVFTINVSLEPKGLFVLAWLRNGSAVVALR